MDVKFILTSQAWWLTHVICESEAHLDYTVGSCLKKRKAILPSKPLCESEAFGLERGSRGGAGRVLGICLKEPSTSPQISAA